MATNRDAEEAFAKLWKIFIARATTTASPESQAVSEMFDVSTPDQIAERFDEVIENVALTAGVVTVVRCGLPERGGFDERLEVCAQDLAVIADQMKALRAALVTRDSESAAPDARSDGDDPGA